MKTLGNIRKKLKNKKGFTLIELIVVIVIIGILAAILVPSVLRYIDKAKERQVMADGRTLYTAATGAIAEAYETEPVKDQEITATAGEITAEDQKLAETIQNDAGITREYDAKFNVKDSKIDGDFTITEGSITAIYDGSVWKIDGKDGSKTTEP